MPRYNNLSEKANILWQRSCHVCSAKTPILMFSIRVTPLSCRNQDSKIKKAFMKAIQTKLGGTHLGAWNGKRLCLSLTFIVNNGNTEKDIDNMSKILMDAFHDIFYNNDRNVDHLDSLKIRSNNNEEFILFRLMESDINEHLDVIKVEYSHGWAGQEVLDLDDYIENK